MMQRVVWTLTLRDHYKGSTREESFPGCKIELLMQFSQAGLKKRSFEGRDAYVLVGVDVGRSFRG